jgi:hypothetical protein
LKSYFRTNGSKKKIVVANPLVGCESPKISRHSTFSEKTVCNTSDPLFYSLQEAKSSNKDSDSIHG